MTRTLAVVRCERMTNTVKLCAQAIVEDRRGAKQGVAGVVMKLFQGSNLKETLTTTASGVVEFATRVPAGAMNQYSVEADLGTAAATHAFVGDPSQDIERGNLFRKTGRGYVHQMTFRLEVADYVAVRVRDARGALVTGLAVVIKHPEEAPIRKTIAQGLLRPDGSLLFAQVPRGRYQVTLPEVDGELWEEATGAPPNPPFAYVARAHVAPPRDGHTVVAGDCVWSLAVKYGVTEDAIWKYDKNSALAKQYKNQYTLLPGQVVHVPAPRRKALSGVSGRCYDIVVKDIPRELKIRLVESGEPAAAGLQGTVKIQGHDDIPVTTDKGAVRFAVPHGATVARLNVPAFGIKDYTLRLGHLAPVESEEGVRQRLEDLGLYVEPKEKRDASAALIHAVHAFQRLKRLAVQDPEPTGKLDAETEKALVAACGS